MNSTSVVSLLHTKNGLKRKGIASHQLSLEKPLQLDLERVKSNANDEQAKTLISAQFEV